MQHPVQTTSTLQVVPSVSMLGGVAGRFLNSTFSLLYPRLGTESSLSVSSLLAPLLGKAPTSQFQHVTSGNHLALTKVRIRKPSQRQPHAAYGKLVGLWPAWPPLYPGAKRRRTLLGPSTCLQPPAQTKAHRMSIGMPLAPASTHLPPPTAARYCRPLLEAAAKPTSGASLQTWARLPCVQRQAIIKKGRI